MYKEQAENLLPSMDQARPTPSQSIFDFGEPVKQTSDTAAKLKLAFAKANEKVQISNEPETSKILDQIAREEARKSDIDIYQEVFIDEINGELMQSVE